MSPHTWEVVTRGDRFPRVSGDEPPPPVTRDGAVMFSPRERG